MFRTALLLFIELIMMVVEWSVRCIVLVKGYGIRVWQNNAMRKWVFDTLDLSLARFRRFIGYLEEIEMLLQSRIAYAEITKPLKRHYRELRRNIHD